MADGFRKSCSYCCIGFFLRCEAGLLHPKGVNVTDASICRHAMSSCVGMYDVSKVSQCFRSLPGDLPEIYVVGEETCRHRHRSQEVSTKCKLSTKFEHPVSQVICSCYYRGFLFQKSSCNSWHLHQKVIKSHPSNLRETKETKEKEKSQSADPEQSTRKRLPRTYSWDTRRERAGKNPCADGIKH